MSEDETDHFLLRAAFLLFLIFIKGELVIGQSLLRDREILLQLQSFLKSGNPVLLNQGKYTNWNSDNWSPCNWPGISCDNSTERVARIDLSDCNIAGEVFGNFSALSELSHLDLSGNTIGGAIPEDLGRCRNLKFLNLSHNIIYGEVNLTGLNNLEILDLSQNRIQVDIRLTIPENCSNLVVANISNNNFTGEVGRIFENCRNLKFLDLSSNLLTGGILPGFDRMEEVSLSENRFSGVVATSAFSDGCRLRVLDLSDNNLNGEFPGEISKCKNLEMLTLWGNKLTGVIPEEIGWLPNIQALYLGNNKFSREIPESLVGLRSLKFLDLSRNSFGGDIQEIFGRLRQVKFLLLHNNSYEGGIVSSRVLELPNIVRLDLSYNKFSGPLPIKISQMSATLKYLILAYNNFTGSIPPEYGNLSGLQALDLSFNSLNGSIPSSFGNLTSLLWLMLANNSLTGAIPPELGSCSSLLWLNLANNHLSGELPPQLTSIGSNATPTFLLNRLHGEQMPAGSGECLAMMRWIPADYPPFSFVYDLLTRKKCRSLWDRILKGYGLFSMCSPGSNIRTMQISGYVQLSGNHLSGEIPAEIGNMLNFSMLHFGLNQFEGELPSGLERIPLVVLNVTRNKFSGEIPMQIGNLKCLQNLDLSYNNFSGPFPSSLNNLSDLTKFNISYNPLISGSIPAIGQMATFDKWSFVGDPLLNLPPFISNETNVASPGKSKTGRKVDHRGIGAFLMVLALILAALVCGVMTLIICLLVKSPIQSPPGYLLGESKGLEFVSSSSSSSPWMSNTIKVIRLDKTAFTHSDILRATRSFSDDRIIGMGGSGTVYRGVLPDGRDVAVKKLQSEGMEGEREFRAEMEVLSGNGFGWPHPNLVTLYGWCLNGSEKLLVYEYMEGGSLEDHITDRVGMNWRRRLEVAIDVARALVFLHHECYPSIVHRDVKASNVLLDKSGKARVTDFGLARVVDAGGSHVSTMVAGTVGYVAPEYGQTWQATTKGDVYSYGVLAMELATGRRAVDGGEECLVEWAKRVMGDGRVGLKRATVPVALLVSGLADGAEKMSELLRVGIWCTAETPHVRPNMKEVLAMLFRISCSLKDFEHV
ncbi:Leucine-rich repeat protein kinase family protein [Perilla frutescens var. hirtella]|nr:Leucine-rich repeat protein kinase family protein [Perilla frutescens var. hirtella]